MAVQDGFVAVGPGPAEPGDVVVVDVDGVPVAVANIRGILYAFDDTCSHRECPLSEGTLDGSLVTCPCHKSRFDLKTGDVLNGPATRPIRVRGVRRDGGELLIER